VELIAMNQRPPDKIIPFAPSPKENIPFAPSVKDGRSGGSVDNVDHTGHSIVSMLQQAVEVAKDNTDRAMDVAHKLSVQLRAAEDRIVQMELEVRRYQERAVRAENWLARVHNEIEDRFFTQNGNSQQSQPAQR
jgi:hypothetical protein